ncbi:MAG: phosphate-selective porin [Sphingomonadales bacterium]|nr:phosphate-selective porin [Sphingomonadales bacterium]
MRHGQHFYLLATAAWLIQPNSANAQALSATEADALRAELAAMKSQLERVESRLNTVAPANVTPVTQTASAMPVVPAKAESAKISWRSAPRISQGGWAFEPIGRIQYDAAYVSRPAGNRDRGLGFSNEARRIRLGGEGSIPGGLGYKIEAEFSDNVVDLVDAFVTYETGKFKLKAGNHNQFQSLDELIGDTTGSVMERAAFTDAFGFERRLGISAEYKTGPWLAQAGVFTDSISSLNNASDGPNGGDENNSYGVDSRLIFAPKIGDFQLHFAGSAHWRTFNRLAEAPLRLRQRPYTHTSNSYALDTGNILARSETHGGVEMAGTSGPLYFAAEYQRLRLDRIDGAAPVFQGGYAEVGYFLTPGDTRPYKDGIFQRSSPAKPIDQGGIGSVQATVRYDYLDLNSRNILGGKQNGVIGALVWAPNAYLRLNLNYARMQYSGRASATPVVANYGLDIVAARIEFDY